MRRRLFTILSVLSLALCLGCAAIASTGEPVPFADVGPAPPQWVKPVYRWGGLLVVDSSGSPADYLLLEMNWSAFALCAVAFGIAPLAWTTRAAGNALYRRRVRNEHSCTTCGYDLRATPDRCPECGGVPTHG